MSHQYRVTLNRATDQQKLGRVGQADENEIVKNNKHFSPEVKSELTCPCGFLCCSVTKLQYINSRSN
jgi:hypothetical protein